MKNLNQKSFIYFFAVSLFVTSCAKEDDPEIITNTVTEYVTVTETVTVEVPTTITQTVTVEIPYSYEFARAGNIPEIPWPDV